MECVLPGSAAIRKRLRESLATSKFRGVPALTVIAMVLVGGWGCRRATLKPSAFDVSSLVGKKAGEIALVVGAPATATSTLGETGSATFKRGEYQLGIEYLKRNGRVTNFTFSFADPAKTVREDDREQLLAAARLKEDDSRYAIDYLEAPDQVLRFSGVKITPNPVTYQVTLRITGASASTQARYTAPPSAATGDVAAPPRASVGSDPKPGEDFLTIPPWELQFSAVTGDVVGIQAGPVGGPAFGGGGREKRTVQILVNGNVVRQFTSELGVAHCELELD